MHFQSFLKLPLLLGVAATTAVYASTPASAPATAKITAPAVTAPAQTTPTGPVDTATLLKQIEELKKQVSHVAYKQRKAEEKLEATTQVEDAKIGVLQASQISPFPEGYIPVSGTNSAVSFAGSRVKIDAGYYGGNSADATAPGGLAYDATAIPLKGIDTAAGKSGRTEMTAQGSRMAINTLSQTKFGDVKAKVIGDFYGTGSSSHSSTSYAFRLREATVEMCSLLVGQTLTNFHDADEGPATLDNNGFTTSSRRTQLRWTQKIMDGLKLMVSAERGNTDYMGQDGKISNNGNGLTGSSGVGKSTIPDLTARLRWEGKLGFVSLRGIVRRLEVNVAKNDAVAGGFSTTAFSNKQTAWGIGSSFKLITTGKSNLYGQANIGDGIGSLITIETLPSAYLQVSTATAVNGTSTNSGRYAARFDTNRAMSGILGYEIWWNDAFRTNVAGSYAKVSNSPFSPVLNGTNQVNSSLKKALINAIYSVTKNIDIGAELIYGVRQTVSGFDNASNTTSGTGAKTYYAGGTGRSTQVMTSFIYKF